jgi:hypothetical protein
VALARASWEGVGSVGATVCGSHCGPQALAQAASGRQNDMLPGRETQISLAMVTVQSQAWTGLPS